MTWMVGAISFGLSLLLLPHYFRDTGHFCPHCSRQVVVDLPMLPCRAFHIMAVHPPGLCWLAGCCRETDVGDSAED
jgi:hypothetical protein